MAHAAATSLVGSMITVSELLRTAKEAVVNASPNLWNPRAPQIAPDYRDERTFVIMPFDGVPTEPA